MDGKLCELFCAQYHREIAAVDYYLKLKNVFLSLGLTGFAKWSGENAAEEHGHAEKIADFLGRQGIVTRPGNGAFKADVDDSKPVYGLVFDAATLEQDYLSYFIEMFKVASEKVDVPAQELITWFCVEQRIAADELRVLVRNIYMSGDNYAALLVIDGSLK